MSNLNGRTELSINIVMSDDYAGYYYKRFKPPKKYFPIIFTASLLLLVFLVLNLFFGFVSFAPKPKKISLPVITFYTQETAEFVSKNEAIAQSTSIKDMGGSGYLLSQDDMWIVIENISNINQEGARIYITMETFIKLANNKHHKIVKTLISAFETTFIILCESIQGYENDLITREDIAHNARLSYNTYLGLINEFELLPYKNEYYHNVTIHFTRLLFALSLIWIDNNHANFSHVLKNAASWVAFAYYDFSYAI